jgi:hypothetical protein
MAIIAEQMAASADLVDPLTNLVKSIAEVTPELVAPHVALWTDALIHGLHSENTQYLTCLILAHITQSKTAC